MKNLMLLQCLLFVSISAFAQTMILPYYGKISCQTICGKDNCQPTRGEKWAKVDALDYNGVVGEFLGTKFTNFMNPGLCLGRVPTDADVEVLRKNTFTANIQASEKNNFTIKVKANLTKLIQQAFSKFPDNVKADLATNITKAVEAESGKQMNVEYKVIQLRKPYIDTEIASNKSKLTKNEGVALGISIITLSGTWSQNTLKKALAELSISTQAFNSMSADLKAEFEKTKETVLNGQFEAFSIISYVSYTVK